MSERRRNILTMVATILGSTIVFLDGTVVNVALPSISDDLNTGLSDQQWVVEAYMLATVSLLLVGGSLGDQFGRRRIFVIGLIGFGITSIACALAPSTAVLIGARRRAGPRRGPADPGLACDPGLDVRGGRARQGHRHMDRLDRDRNGLRAGGWRRAGRGVLLAGDLLDQRAADPLHDRDDAEGGQREQGPPG
ncbi:MAG: MFS transporter [Solirubrobacterales bacterium]|nr:MFS transporter [Solirubrobacterales bacterium]